MSSLLLFPAAKGPYPRIQKEALIAQKRAEIAAKLAAMRSGPNTAHASPASRTPAPTHPPSPGPSAASAHFAEDVGKRIAEAKRKVAEAQNKLATKDNPYMVIRFLSLSSTNYYGLF